jgi:hypothetical protein
MSSNKVDLKEQLAARYGGAERRSPLLSPDKAKDSIKLPKISSVKYNPIQNGGNSNNNTRSSLLSPQKTMRVTDKIGEDAKSQTAKKLKII